MDPVSSFEVEVFFDGDCPLCLREISLLRRLDERGQRIRFTDIQAADFSPESVGLTFPELMRRIHGRLPSGELIEGTEVFRRLYAAVGFRRTVAVSRWPGVAQRSSSATRSSPRTACASPAAARRDLQLALAPPGLSVKGERWQPARANPTSSVAERATRNPWALLARSDSAPEAGLPRRARAFLERGAQWRREQQRARDAQRLRQLGREPGPTRTPSRWRRRSSR